MGSYWNIHRIKADHKDSDMLEIFDNGDGAMIQFSEESMSAGFIVLNESELGALIEILTEIKKRQDENT